MLSLCWPRSCKIQFLKFTNSEYPVLVIVQCIHSEGCLYGIFRVPSFYNLELSIRVIVGLFWFYLRLLLTSVFKTTGIGQLATLV